MTMYGGLHPKSNVHRLYVSVERCIREEESRLGFYVINSEENVFRGVSAAETINTRETIKSAEFKKQKANKLKEKWSEKRMHG